jgi:hypothetical protein
MLKAENKFTVDSWFVKGEVTVGLELGSTQGEVRTKTNEKTTTNSKSTTVTFPSQVGEHMTTPLSE